MEFLEEHPEYDPHTKKRDPREYARERAKFAPPKRRELFVGPPHARMAKQVVLRYLSRLHEAATHTT